MRQEVERDAVRSARCFDTLVKAELERLLSVNHPGSVVKRTDILVTEEGVNAFLDTGAGVDAIHISPVVVSAADQPGRKYPMTSIRAVAYRVQWGKSYDTFTIRYSRVTGNPTEWEKLLFAQDNRADGWISPVLHVHAYVSTDETKLLSLGIVETALLVRFMIEHKSEIPLMKNRDGSQFFVVTWASLRKLKVPFFARRYKAGSCT